MEVGDVDNKLDGAVGAIRNSVLGVSGSMRRLDRKPPGDDGSSSPVWGLAGGDGGLLSVESIAGDPRVTGDDLVELGYEETGDCVLNADDENVKTSWLAPWSEYLLLPNNPGRWALKVGLMGGFPFWKDCDSAFALCLYADINHGVVIGKSHQ